MRPVYTLRLNVSCARLTRIRGALWEIMMANAGIVGLDWQQRINWDRLRKYRLERARERMKAHGLGAMLLMYDENVRYVTSTLTPGWNRLKPACVTRFCAAMTRPCCSNRAISACTSRSIRRGFRKTTSATRTPGSRVL